MFVTVTLSGPQTTRLVLDVHTPAPGRTSAQTATMGAQALGASGALSQFWPAGHTSRTFHVPPLHSSTSACALPLHASERTTQGQPSVATSPLPGVAQAPVPTEPLSAPVAASGIVPMLPHAVVGAARAASAATTTPASARPDDGGTEPMSDPSHGTRRLVPGRSDNERG
jgi:hypothetical protein